MYSQRSSNVVRRFKVPIAALALALWLAAVASIGSERANAAGEPPDVVLNRYLAALRSGDPDRAALYVANGAFFGMGYDQGSRKAIVAGGSIELESWKARLPKTPDTRSPAEFLSGEVNGDTFTVHYRYGLRPLAGVDHVLGTWIVTVKDGKITSYLDYLDVSDSETLKWLKYQLGGKDPLSMPAIPLPGAPAPPSTGTGLRPAGTGATEWLPLAAMLFAAAGVALLAGSRKPG